MKHKKRPFPIMRKQKVQPLDGREKRNALCWYLLLLFLSALPHLIGFLLMRFAGEQAALYFIVLYGLIPLTALILPFLACYHRAEPLLTFFPAGLMLLVSPVYQAAGLAVALFALSLIASAAGQELYKRRSGRKGA